MFRGCKVYEDDRSEIAIRMSLWFWWSVLAPTLLWIFWFIWEGTPDQISIRVPILVSLGFLVIGWFLGYMCGVMPYFSGMYFFKKKAKENK